MSLTESERRTLQRIAIVLEQQTKGLLERHLNCTPTEWVSKHVLIELHGQRRKDIASLIAKGYLTERCTDGWGLEVKLSKVLVLTQESKRIP